MYETINDQLKEHFYNNPIIEDMLQDKQRRVLANRQSSFTAAHEVLQFYFNNLLNHE